jgi:vacuolar protein 8
VQVLKDASADGATKANAAFALGNLAAATDADNRAAIVAAGAIPLLVELLRGGSENGRANAAFVLGNLSTGDDAITTVVVAAGTIPC